MVELKESKFSFPLTVETQQVGRLTPISEDKYEMDCKWSALEDDFITFLITPSASDPSFQQFAA